MLSNNLIARRLQKQEQSIIKQPIEGVLVHRQGLLNFHFVLYNLDHPYKDGFYYGLLQLHANYPFSAPKLFFYTRSGRFQVNLAICTSFTNYHQQTWTSAWNIRTLLLATVSFMTSQEFSYGCRNDSVQTRVKYAKNSLKQNLKNDKFCEYFITQLQKINVNIPSQYLKNSQAAEQLSNNNKNHSSNNPTLQPHQTLIQNIQDEQQRVEVPINHQEQLLPKQHGEQLAADRVRNRRKIFIGLLVVIVLIIFLLICLH